MYQYELENYNCNYVTDGTLHGFYSTGIFYDSNSEKSKDDCFIGFMIGRGLPKLIECGSDFWYRNSLYEPVEYEVILVRPILKYPKRNFNNTKERVNYNS